MERLMKNVVVLMLVLGFNSLYAQEELVFTNGQWYNTGEQQSTHQTFYKNGDVKAKYKLQNGVLNGEAIFFDEQGNKTELGFFKDGEKHGDWIRWNDQQQKIGEASYYYGEKDGQWKIWNDEGQQLYEMHYDQGEKIGTWKMWNENGELVSEKEH